MNEQEFIGLLLQASPSLIFAVALFALVWKAKDIIAGIRALIEVLNEGERIRREREAITSEAGIKAVEIAVRSMEEQAKINAKNAQEFVQQIIGHSEIRQKEMLAGMRLLEGENQELHGEINELRDQLEDRDKQIAGLRDEVDSLRARLNGMAKKPAARKKAA